MSVRLNDPLLTVSRIVVLVIQVLLGIAALALTAAIPFVLFGKSLIEAEIDEEAVPLVGAFPSLQIAGLMLAGLVVVVLAFVFLRHLGRIIDTVGDGDPFVPDNADRLRAMGWLMLGIQIATVAMVPLIVAVQRAFEETRPSMETDVDLSGIVLVLVLFILARVFRHGAAMREDLEGTV
ncbi:DUF2975 domain-containing protein [Aurantiacibacter spongiae]|uniref:DUF2975 domain-containing protein n=1 Tax=Aurantiacibacter spongiae TaxID=2488860 RepID=A0A3N5CQ79_9SPHN|nr:DUF2975 domain-containing protein [Aurantiacibacter spongiae]RPF71203.1 DUF2975 domain-containing protein [Aurantiacibacter spongiae]